MKALIRPVETGANVSVRPRVFGFLSDELSAHARASIRQLIDDYQSGYMPVIAPLNLVGHHVR